jgi:HlyD family secretion protein
LVRALGGVTLAALAFLILRPKPLPADFATVRRGALQVTIDEEGETRVRHRYVVSAPLAGRVLRIELEPGDPVSADSTVLATFQSSDPVLLDARSRAETEARIKAARSGLGQAKAERERIRAGLRQATAELERYRRLAAEEIVAAEVLEKFELSHVTAEEAVHAAGFAVESAEHELARARASLLEVGSLEEGHGDEPILLRSPIEGVVLRRLRESEAVVPAGEPLLEVGDPQNLEIVADLLSRDAVKVRVGQQVLIEQWGGDASLHGTVRRLEPSGFTKISALGVEEQRVNVLIDFTDPSEAWGALGDGYRVEVRIVVWEAKDTLKVPTSSLFRHDEGWAVFVVEEEVAALRPVILGPRNGLEAQITEGLEEGERVIVHPGDGVEDGVSVAPRTS